MRRSTTVCILLLLLLSGLLWAQSAPQAFVLPAGESIAIVLGDTDRSVSAFLVYRSESDRGGFTLLTEDPVLSVKDPYVARELMGSDFRWLAGKIGTADPPTVWRRLSMDRNRSLAYCLISHGLRVAMGRTFVDSTVAAGRNYTYRIVFLDASAREISRVERRVNAGEAVLPEKPDSVRAEPADREVTIQWEYPRYQGGEDTVVGFHIYRIAKAGNPVRLTREPVLRADGYLEYVDELVDNGVSYRYSVTAIDLIGSESPSTASEYVIPQDTTPPLVPMGITAVDDGEVVTVLWNVSPNLDVAYYEVLRSTRSNEGFDKVNINDIPFDNPRFSDDTIIRGVTHYYKIVAVDTSGNVSPPGGPAYVSPYDTDPPGPVTALEVEVYDMERSVSLTWDRASEPDIRGYYVYRGGSEDTVFRMTQSPLAFEEQPFYTDNGYKQKGLVPGSSLVYAVSAVDMSYNEGPLSYLAIEMPDRVPPDPPFSLSARSTPEGSVVLSWMMKTEEEIIGFKILRTVEDGSDTRIDIDGFVTRFTDAHTVRGRQHEYSVCAVDASGNESAPSKMKAIVPTDLSPPDPPADVQVTATDTGVEITWEPSIAEDVVGYYIYSARYHGAGFRRIISNLVLGSKYTHPSSGHGHLYAVSSIDSSGNEGRRSMAASAKEGE